MKLITPTTDIGVRTGTFGLWAHGTDIYENDKSHIKEIVAAPEVFGLEDAWVRSVFERHGEKLGIEADARPRLSRPPRETAGFASATTSETTTTGLSRVTGARKSASTRCVHWLFG